MTHHHYDVEPIVNPSDAKVLRENIILILLPNAHPPPHPHQRQQQPTHPPKHTHTHTHPQLQICPEQPLPCPYTKVVRTYAVSHELSLINLLVFISYHHAVSHWWFLFRRLIIAGYINVWAENKRQFLPTTTKCTTCNCLLHSVSTKMTLYFNTVWCLITPTSRHLSEWTMKFIMWNEPFFLDNSNCLDKRFTLVCHVQQYWWSHWLMKWNALLYQKFD